MISWKIQQILGFFLLEDPANPRVPTAGVKAEIHLLGQGEKGKRAEGNVPDLS